MFRSTARRATPQPAPSDDHDASRGRHHRGGRERETHARAAALARARRRTSQVGAWEAVSGPVPAVTSAQRTPTRPEPVAPARIDNVVARRDPLTRPFPVTPSLPGPRRALPPGRTTRSCA